MGVRPGLQRDLQGKVHLVRRSSRRQRYTHRGIVASRGDLLLLPHDDRHLSSGHRTEDYSSSSSVASSSSNSLDLFSRTDQGFRQVGNRLLLRAPGLLGRRRGAGRVGSHTTSVIVLWRGPERPDQTDQLQWETWAKPIGFMQR